MQSKPSDFSKVIVDTTVRPKAVAFLTDAKLMHQARELLVRLARKHRVTLRQSYARVGNRALIAHQRYAHAKQFRRANRELRSVRTHLGRVFRDIVRKTRNDANLRRAAVTRLPRAPSASQPARPEGLSLHAPEVECIGKGQAHRPYEFGVKVSVATTLNRSKAASSSPTSRRCRATLMTATRSRLSSRRSRPRSARASPASSPTAATAATTLGPDHKMKVYVSGQKRGLTEAIKRDLRRRSAVEPVIGHAKGEHRMGRNFLKGTHGDSANAVLPAAGYNFRRLPAWLAITGAPSSWRCSHMRSTLPSPRSAKPELHIVAPSWPMRTTSRPTKKRAAHEWSLRLPIITLLWQIYSSDRRSVFLQWGHR
jgi:IS5 family transposase